MKTFFMFNYFVTINPYRISDAYRIREAGGQSLSKDLHHLSYSSGPANVGAAGQ